jgi:hypothetical protein
VRPFPVAHQSLPDAEPAGSSVEEALFAPPPTDPTPRVPVDAAVWVAVRRSNVFFANCVVRQHAYVFGLWHHIGCAAKICWRGALTRRYFVVNHQDSLCILIATDNCEWIARAVTEIGGP